MFYLPQAVLAWICALHYIDWRRTRELLVYGLWGSFLAFLQDTVGGWAGLWEYQDGFLESHHLISLVIACSAAPLMGMFFAQGLKPGAPPPWPRIAGVTAVSLIPEVLGLYTGHILHHNWWSMYASTVAYIPVWLSFWALHRWLTKAP